MTNPSAQTKAPRSNSGKETILLVDDDPQAVDILARLLTMQGYATIPATSGEECLRIARSSPVDVILLDVMMPDMDGITVARELAGDDKTRGIPVILLTGKDDHETRSAGMMLGVSEFLTKPVIKTELYLRIKSQLHQRKEARRIDQALEEMGNR